MSILHELRDQLTAALKDQKDCEHCEKLDATRTKRAGLRARAKELEKKCERQEVDLVIAAAKAQADIARLREAAQRLVEAAELCTRKTVYGLYRVTSSSDLDVLAAAIEAMKEAMG